eukprot:TRINITY_DN4342_c0_g2_i5.p1 TRINITY_DN4342_c0_g2~~TRINITY_DN4342_c0_g2_i5.p1  ORF type:complete len:123 (-),score=1.23 TRINITY_DN4342_c0_g2_i5:384-752(-)
MDLSNHLTKLKSLSDMILDFGDTGFNDEGCKGLAQVLQISTTVSHLTIHMLGTKLSDVGFWCFASKLPILPLQTLCLTFNKTKISDQAMISFSEVLRRISSQLSDFTLGLGESIITILLILS